MIDIELQSVHSTLSRLRRRRRSRHRRRHRRLWHHLDRVETVSRQCPFHVTESIKGRSRMNTENTSKVI